MLPSQMSWGAHWFESLGREEGKRGNDRKGVPSGCKLCRGIGTFLMKSKAWERFAMWWILIFGSRLRPLMGCFERASRSLTSATPDRKGGEKKNGWEHPKRTNGRWFVTSLETVGECL